MDKILVFRFSAMGDVIMLLPVLKGVLDTNRSVEIFLVTQKNFFPFFQGIERLTVIPIDLKSEHRNFVGLYKLFLKLRKTIKPDLVVDLHGVIRTYILDFYFVLSGFKVVKFRKGTIEKLNKIRFKSGKYLPNTVDRYSEVFKLVGLDFSLALPPLFPLKFSCADIDNILSKKIVVGIAPFAKHRQKIWGLDHIVELISYLNSVFDCRIVLFGGGAEIDLLKKVAECYTNCIISADYFSLHDEIQVIHRLSVMVCMDSANMHISAMAGVPTVSIWGATHPSLGFAPYHQPDENIIQYSGEKLTCRPCSVYGNKRCKFGDDIRCMNYISAQEVFVKVHSILNKTNLSVL